jgi:AcrR family transcriptional regulator
MEVKDKIISEASDLMMQYGIRTVTMDDISKNLGISKKTIYQYFKDKKEIVNTITQQHLELEEKRFSSAATDSKDSIHELILVSQCLREAMKYMKMSLMKELQKFYPEAWVKYEDFKSNIMMDSICQVIKRGQSEGYFRATIDPELIATMRIEQVQSFIVENLYRKEKYSLPEVQLHLFDHFIHGLFTIKGHQLFNQYSNINENQDESLV